jgi:hypothetical protein
MKHKILVNILALLLSSEIILAFDIQRRKDQYTSTSGYLLAPAPYSIPGIGEGFFLLGMVNNINNTQTDFIADIITGDVSGYGIGIMEWYPTNKHLKFDFFNESLDRATIQSYSTRGMNSNKDDFIYLNINNMQFTGVRATASFYEKMVEFYLMGYSNQYSIGKLTDKNNNLILSSTTHQTQKNMIYTSGMMIDYTDDRIDPRVGIRFDASLDYSKKNAQTDTADFYIANYNLTGYLPIGEISTLAFNYFRSDAHLKNIGETDFSKVSQKLGLDCSLLTGINKQECENVINNQILANINGTATTLGGRTRLRSYPEMRFSGAHTEFYGTELRWNWTEETTPFDIWFMKDIRTSVQSSLFYEKGSVAENSNDLGKNEKQSYGTGLRMITGSGLVYRFDMAWGDEGYEYTMIINYPWEIF